MRRLGLGGGGYKKSKQRQKNFIFWLLQAVIQNELPRWPNTCCTFPNRGCCSYSSSKQRFRYFKRNIVGFKTISETELYHRKTAVQGFVYCMKLFTEQYEITLTSCWLCHSRWSSCPDQHWPPAAHWQGKRPNRCWGLCGHCQTRESLSGC